MQNSKDNKIKNYSFDNSKQSYIEFLERELKKKDQLLYESLKQKTEELIKVKSELEEKKRLADIGMLSAMVAHELRNPFAAITLAVHNIIRKNTDPGLDVNLNNILRKIKSSENIIENLLFYSRLKYPELKDIDVHTIISECFGDSKKINNRNIRVVCEIEEPVKIQADELQIKEVFLNVLNNACDAVDEKDGEITITYGVLKGKYLEVAVSDNGIGIKKKYLKNVYDPFFTTKTNGSGLGLSICYKIVKMHKGRISVSSKEDGGTKVNILLPLFDKKS